MAQQTRRVAVIATDNGERLDVFGAPMIVKSDGGNTGFFLAEHPIPPGYGVPPHVHADNDEAFYVLDGEVTLLGEAGETKAGPGSAVLLPSGIAHGFRNDTDHTVRLLVVCQHGVQPAEMFRHFDRAGQAPDGLRPAEIGGIAGQYGVRML